MEVPCRYVGEIFPRFDPALSTLVVSGSDRGAVSPKADRVPVAATHGDDLAPVLNLARAFRPSPNCKHSAVVQDTQREPPSCRDRGNASPLLDLALAGIVPASSADCSVAVQANGVSLSGIGRWMHFANRDSSDSLPGGYEVSPCRVSASGRHCAIRTEPHRVSVSGREYRVRVLGQSTALVTQLARDGREAAAPGCEPWQPIPEQCSVRRH